MCMAASMPGWQSTRGYTAWMTLRRSSALRLAASRRDSGRAERPKVCTIWRRVMLERRKTVSTLRAASQSSTYSPAQSGIKRKPCVGSASSKVKAVPKVASSAYRVCMAL